jgi:adenylosuccinate synthase
MNQIRELARGMDDHGSCGVGIGETAADALADPLNVMRAFDLRSHDTIHWKLKALKYRKLAEAQAIVQGKPSRAMHEPLLLLNDGHIFKEILNNLFIIGRAMRIDDRSEMEASIAHGNIVLEGAQGILLDEWFGFHPHTTWSTTTSANARAFLVNMGFHGSVGTIGVTRAYATRHGAGPFPTWDESISNPLEHNKTHPWQGGFRHGAFDAVTARYALAADPAIDALAVTCLDHAPQHVCDRYRVDGGGVRSLKLGPPGDLAYTEKLGAFLRVACPERKELIGISHSDWIARALGKPVLIESWGPRHEDKKHLSSI